jgi:hypothetical protein
MSDELVQIGKNKRYLRRDARGRFQVVISEENACNVGRLRKAKPPKKADGNRDRKRRQRSA